MFTDKPWYSLYIQFLHEIVLKLNIYDHHSLIYSIIGYINKSADAKAAKSIITPVNESNGLPTIQYEIQ